MLGRAILYTIVTALLVADQTWFGFGTAVPQLVVGGVNVLVVVAAFLHALQTNPISGTFGTGFLGLSQDKSNGVGAGSKPAAPSGGESLNKPMQRRGPNGRRMFRGVPPVAMLALCISLVGIWSLGASCQPTIQNVINVANSIEQDTQVIEGGVVAAWPTVLAFIPDAEKAQAQATFDNAKATLDDSLVALSDLTAGGTYILAGDVFNAMLKVSDAVTQLYNAVNIWTPPSAVASNPKLSGVQVRLGIIGQQVATLKARVTYSVQTKGR